MTIQEAFSNFIGERLENVKASPKFSNLLKQAEKKEKFLLTMLDSSQSDLFLELQKINKQIYVNDDFDAYKAGFLDALILFVL